MARITAGVGSSHVPLLGVAVDQGKSRDDYFGPIFAGYDWTREWEKSEKPDVVIVETPERYFAHVEVSPNETDIGGPARDTSEGFEMRTGHELPLPRGPI